MAEQTVRRTVPGQQDKTVKLAPATHQQEARKSAVKELLQLPMIPLAAMGALETARNDGAISPYSLDVIAIDMHSESLATGVVELAERFPVLGAVLDRIGNVTPFGALAAAAMALGCQIAENHGALPETMKPLAPSLISRRDLAQQLYEQGQKLASNGSDG